MSFLIGKSFCSWLCPVGFISEMVGSLSDKIFKKRIEMPKFLDIALRSLKYLLLAFLFYSVIFLMGGRAVKAFLDSPYNIVADIKMYYFFANISRLSAIVLLILLFLSLIFRNFWCRYLCPYGALLGLVSLLSPAKIKRNKDTCIDCEACTKACPSAIKVHKVSFVLSDECTSCMNCIESCPVKNTLYLTPVHSKKKIDKKFVGIIVVAVFVAITGLGLITGYWQNKVSKEEYQYYFPDIEKLGHPTDMKSIKEYNK